MTPGDPDGPADRGASAPQAAALPRWKLVERLVRRHLAGSDALPLTPPAAVADLSERQREVVGVRCLILDAWQGRLEAAKRAGKSRDAATAALLKRLKAYQGVRISRGTLYNWKRRRLAGGDAGLADGRATPPNVGSKVDRGAVDGPSNGRRPTV